MIDHMIVGEDVAISAHDHARAKAMLDARAAGRVA